MKKLFGHVVVAAMLLSTVGAVAQQKYGAGPLEFSSLKEWKKVHRPAIMEFFLNDVYGHYPQKQIFVNHVKLSIRLLLNLSNLLKTC